MVVGRVERLWQVAFERLSRPHGFATRINSDVFRLTYASASRYDRYDHRQYEPVFYQALMQAIRAGMTVFDIGAHIGLVTLAAAKRVGATGRVYAFKPAPETVRVLTRHIELNGWSDRVEVVQAVVSDRDGVVPFYAYGVSMAASISRENVEVLNPEQRATPARRVEVPSVTLDQFCAHHNVRPEVLKIDVEGAELLVLRGARDLLLNGSVGILCEVHPAQMENCGSSVTELEPSWRVSTTVSSPSMSPTRWASSTAPSCAPMHGTPDQRPG